MTLTALCLLTFCGVALGNPSSRLAGSHPLELSALLAESVLVALLVASRDRIGRAILLWFPTTWITYYLFNVFVLLWEHNLDRPLGDDVALYTGVLVGEIIVVLLEAVLLGILARRVRSADAPALRFRSALAIAAIGNAVSFLGPLAYGIPGVFFY